MTARGEITDAKTLAAIWYEQWFRKPGISTGGTGR